MKIKGMIEYNIGADMQKEKALKVFLNQDTARLRDFISAGITPLKSTIYYKTWFKTILAWPELIELLNFMKTEPELDRIATLYRAP